MSPNLSQAVGTLSACLTAINGMAARTADENTVRVTFGSHKRAIQQLLQQRVFDDIVGVLTGVKKEVQILIEALSDAIDHSRSGSSGSRSKYDDAMCLAATLAAQLIDEISTGHPRDARIAAERTRTKRPYRCGYSAAVPIRYTERGIPNNRRARYAFVGCP